MSQTDKSRLAWRDLVASSKKKKGPLYTRYVNRNAALPLTWVFWKLGLHPNVVTGISFTVTHLALLMLVLLPTTLPLCVGIWLMLTFGFMLDSSDGQLARVSGRTSKAGEWLDHTLDMAKILNVNMAFSYALIAGTLAADLPLTIPLLAAFVNLLSQPTHYFVIIFKDSFLERAGSSRDSTSVANPGFARNAVMNFADYGLFILMPILIPWPKLFGIVYLVYGLFYMCFFIAHFLLTTRDIMRGTQQLHSAAE
jgi:phosphatidylglycerophosphate synthase